MIPPEWILMGFVFYYVIVAIILVLGEL